MFGNKNAILVEKQTNSNNCLCTLVTRDVLSRAYNNFMEGYCITQKFDSTEV